MMMRNWKVHDKGRVGTWLYHMKMKKL